MLKKDTMTLEEMEVKDNNLERFKFMLKVVSFILEETSINSNRFQIIDTFMGMIDSCRISREYQKFGEVLEIA